MSDASGEVRVVFVTAPDGATGGTAATEDEWRNGAPGGAFGSVPGVTELRGGSGL